MRKTLFTFVAAAALATIAAGCPEAKTVSNDIAVISAELCSEAAQQPNDPAWVALVCAVVSDVNQIIQASPDGGYLASAPTGSREVVVPRAQWDAIRMAAAKKP